MRTVPYLQVLQSTARRCGLDPQNIDVAEAAVLRDAISDALETAVEFAEWPDFKRLEERVPVSRLVAFDAPGEVIHEVWSLNPRTTMEAARLQYELTHDGIQLFADTDPVWVDYRLPTPRLFGENYDSNESYSVGDQVYFRGDYYNCVMDVEPDESPEENISWSLVEIPVYFKRYLVQSAYASWLLSDGQNDKAGIEQRAAEQYLAAQNMILTGHQQQRRRLVVLTR